MATDENIQVVVRCRPMSKKEIEEGNQNVVETETKSVELVNLEEKSSRRFEFDWVFGQKATQREIYLQAAKGIVDNVLEGYNGTIFAYGQTGTGKTYTMEGRGKDGQGIIPNTFSHIFEHIAKAPVHQHFLVRASYIEIYNEEIRDLLSKNSSARLEIRERPEVGVYVTGLSTFIANDPRDLKKIMTAGSRSRAKGETEMNQCSSRSHVIFTTTVECCEPGADGCKHVRVGKLHLVDLAGSERQSKTKASGQRLKEANKINLSLSTLGNVISALVDAKSSHVPYRNSKLTRLLKDSLGGNSKTLMCANIGPADYNYEETLSTLRFANRAKNIKNKARINEDPKDAVLRQLQLEIEELRKKLEEGSGDSTGTEEEDDDDSSNKKSKEQQKKPKTYTSEQLKAIQTKLKLDRKMLLEQKGIAEEEKKKLEEELKSREKELNRAQQEHKELLEKLRTMEKKIIIGGVNLLKKAEIQEQLLKESAKELEENKRMEMELQKRLQQQENERLTIEEQYSSLQDDINEKDRKLKKALMLVMNTRTELSELQHEHQVDLTEQLEVVRGLSRDLQQATALIDYFIPVGYQQLLEQSVTWDENTGEWHMRGLAYAGCNREIQPTSSPPHQTSRRLKGDLSAVYFAYTPNGAERALQLKLGLAKSKKSRRHKETRHNVTDPILRQYNDLCPRRPETCECPREMPWRPFRPCYVNQCPHLGPLMDEFYQFYYYYLTKNMMQSQSYLSKLYQAPFYPRTFFCSRPPVRPAIPYC